MQSLKHLVDIQGVTVVAVIHQPRKFIFDLFDSLILLGVGGRMVYHGAVDKSLTYFRNLNYTLPPGESLADWLIDISSGRLEPDNLVASSKVLEVEKAKEEKAKESKTKKSKEKKSKTKKSKGKSRGKSPHSARLTAASRQASQGLVVRRSGPKETKNAVEHAAPGTPVRDSDAVGSRGVATGKVAQAFEEAKARRAWLYEEWNSYFTNLSEADLDIYDVPEKSDLPKEVVKPAFYKQFYFQMWRALLVAWRNRVSKTVDSLVIIGAAILISLLDGVQNVAVDRNPQIPFVIAVRPRPEDSQTLAIQLFQYAAAANQLP